jgi:DNA-binding GntR family transcriptional regulator
VCRQAKAIFIYAADGCEERKSLNSDSRSADQGTVPVSRTPTATEVADVLRKRILAGQYREDGFIRQESIARELGVSRIPVREALAQLEGEGLVVREKYRGAMVPKLSSEEIQEVFELRAMLEPYLLRNAFHKIAGPQLAVLRDIMQRARAMKNISEWAGLNVEFHRTLYYAADKPVASQILENLLVRADRYLKLQTLSTASTIAESDRQHETILNFIESGDVEGAVAALRQHIDWTADDAPKTLGLKSRNETQ